MKTNYISLCLAWILVIAAFFVPLNALAENETQFNGTILNVEGQRMEIEISEDEAIWVTTNLPISEELEGSNISGHYIPAGDTLLLIDSSLDGQ